MLISRLGWSLGTLLAFVVCAGCGSSGDDGPVDQNDITFGSEFEAVSVTDTAAGALTEEQVEEIRAKCEDGAGVPGSNDDCLNSLPNLLPPCRTADQWCVYGGVLSGENAGVIRVVEQGGEAKSCPDPVCSGITVPVGVVDVLVVEEETDTTSSTTSTPTTDTTAPTTTTPSTTTPTTDTTSPTTSEITPTS